MSEAGDGQHVNGTLGRIVGGSLFPDISYWLLAGLAVTLATNVRGRRHLPTPSVSAQRAYLPPLWQGYGVCVIPLFCDIYIETVQKQTKSHRDLQAIETRALLHAGAWLRKTKASANPTSESVPDTDPGGVGLPPSSHGISYLAWKFRGHLFLDDRAWNHFYRTLVLGYADKYPDITPADWDTCVSHVASTAILIDTVKPMMRFSFSCCMTFIGAVALSFMTSRWAARPRMLLPCLNSVAKLGWYGTTPFALAFTSIALHHRRPLHLQDKTRVAEMLGKTYVDVDWQYGLLSGRRRLKPWFDAV